MVKFADRMNQLKGSEIRELLKVAADPTMISFAGGLPAKEMFPVKEMTAASLSVLNENGQAAMQYATTEGDPELRQQIADRMLAKNGIKTDIDHILMTPGSQMGLDFSGRIFLNKDDIVLLESPSYLGAINAFKTNEAKFIEVPTDGDGMIIEELDKILAKEDRVRMIYVIPDFQNPTGVTWTLERRKSFIEVINKYDVPVIEDNPYGELIFDGESLPSLKSLDTKGLVVFLGTFSKILAPGYRLGWVCAEDKLLAKYNAMEQASCLQTSTVAMLQCARWIRDYDLDEHVDAVKKVYKKRRDCMMKAMEDNFPKECKWTHSKGGLFTWVVLPEYLNAKELAPQVLERKVAYVPGGSFFPNGGHENTFRLNYSCMPEEKIKEGIAILGDVLKKNIR